MAVVNIADVTIITIKITGHSGTIADYFGSQVKKSRLSWRFQDIGNYECCNIPKL